MDLILACGPNGVNNPNPTGNTPRKRPQKEYSVNKDAELTVDNSYGNIDCDLERKQDRDRSAY